MPDRPAAPRWRPRRRPGISPAPGRRALGGWALGGWAPGRWAPGRWALSRWARLPRRTVRLRLTLLYGGLFLLCGAGTLAITYVLVSHRLPVLVTSPSGVLGQGGQVCFTTAPVTELPVLPPPNCFDAAQVAGQQRATELAQLLTESGIALAIMTVVSLGLGWLVAGRVLRPLRTITAAARSISATSLHARLALSGPGDELKELGDTFDGLLARLEAAFAAQRQFVANASHELRTPLARQQTLIEVALADPDRSVASLQEVCGRVLATGKQQERLIEALLTLARGQRGLDRREPFDLATITAEMVLARQLEADLRGLQITSRLTEAPIVGDPQLVERMVANLLDNAIRHNVPGGMAEVTTGTQAGRAVLALSNTGPPIRLEDVGRLFEPFRRGGRDRTGSCDGLGLGLSIVAAIAAAHGASLQASALPRGGLAVRVGFPAGGPLPAHAGHLASVPGPPASYPGTASYAEH